MPQLNDLFTGWMSGSGIFATMQSMNVPWKSLSIALQLDLEYHGNHSGQKVISPLVRQYHVGTGPLSASEKNSLAQVIVALYSNTWARQWAAYNAEYNPIENYSMTERMTNDETVDTYGKITTRTDDLTHTKTGTETETPDLTEERTPNLTTATDNSVYGFNSFNPVPSDGQSVGETGTDTTTKTGTNEREYDLTDADTGTQTHRDSGSDTRTRNYLLTRSGNIGVTTSQQMLESEMVLWSRNFFFDVVFPDIDRVLTIQIY